MTYKQNSIITFLILLFYNEIYGNNLLIVGIVKCLYHVSFITSYELIKCYINILWYMDEKDRTSALHPRMTYYIIYLVHQCSDVRFWAVTYIHPLSYPKYHDSHSLFPIPISVFAFRLTQNSRPEKRTRKISF